MNTVIGLDFGTTNSALAVAASNGTVSLARFQDGASTTNTFKSIIYFPDKKQEPPAAAKPVAGPDAIRRYLEADTKGRLIQSIKSYLASRLFTHTVINGRSYTIEDLIAIILRQLREASHTQFGELGTRVVFGRPVNFSGAEKPEDEAFALERLRASAATAGFENISFEFEPIAAAYHYERQLDHDELVLIGDFGGGTSDFTLIRLGPSRRRDEHHRSHILGTDGLGVAGDTFDSRSMMQLVAPRLGLGSRYRSLGRELSVPVWIYSKLANWHLMSFLKTPETMSVLNQVRSQAVEPEKIEAVIHVVKNNLGYKLYRAVERTKVELTERETGRFAFTDYPVEIEASVEQWQFESWIQQDVQAIAACVERLLKNANVTARDVDSVFLTGGTSFVPVVRRFFQKRFGADRLRSGDELTTVAKGLALCALDR
ncbi:MAG TPA: Hsp70 family protein [Pyrinomonadaceae bacterium]|nr:Hsp70 family protein [Pyrinomonadaceae bacterium]